MPYPNRINPFGDLFATPARGTLTGNRGCLHNDRREIRRRWTTRAWITCLLEFRGRHRDIMPPGRWTALFFLDEATGLAAGHRPCGECRNADYRRFKQAWCAGNGGDVTEPVGLIDVRLQAERIARPRPTWMAPLAGLPDGTMWLEGSAVWVVSGSRIARWTPSGYRDAQARPAKHVPVLTPPTLVAALKAGYRPLLHPSFG